MTFTGRPPITWPHLVGKLPPLADCRQGRPADDTLAQALVGGPAPIVCQVVAGLGGVGKTQLAANLAHRQWRTKQVDLLIWTSATSRSSIITTYAQAAADIIGDQNDDPRHAADRFLAWLAGTNRPWLIVLDDLIDPDDLTGLWPPDTAADGRTVITTRRRDASLVAGRHVVNVDLFTPAQSSAYLNAKLAGTSALNDDADGVAADLGRLPLALAQAVAYMIDRKLTCTGYRRRFATRQLTALTPLSLPDQHQAIVAATWHLSVELADQLTSGVGRMLLQLAALLDPHGIPTGMFTSDAVTAYCRRRSGRCIDADDIHDALHVLHQLSLAVIDDTGALCACMHWCNAPSGRPSHPPTRRLWSALRRTHCSPSGQMSNATLPSPTPCGPALRFSAGTQARPAAPRHPSSAVPGYPELRRGRPCAQCRRHPRAAARRRPSRPGPRAPRHPDHPAQRCPVAGPSRRPRPAPRPPTNSWSTTDCAC